MRTGRHQHMTDPDNTDQDNLPAKTTTGNVVIATEQSGSLVARGLEAVRNRSERPLSSPSEADLEKSFRDACDHGDYESALRIIHLLEDQGSASAEELSYHLYIEAQPIDLFRGDENEDEGEVVSDRVKSCLRKAAERGDALAQDMLASLYCDGSWADEGNPENNAEAAKWSRKAAEQGRQHSQNNLGIMYYTGKKGVPQDYAEAMKWFRKAAEQKPKYAQYAQFKIGDMYYNGHGVPQDYAEAMKWFRKVAEQKYDVALMKDAQFKLSDMSYRGESVPRDFVQAYMWLAIILITSRATSFDDQGTDWFNKLASKMTPAQIAEAQMLAEEWTKTHAS